MICRICLEEKEDKEFIYCYLCNFMCCKECFIKNTKINKTINCLNCKRNFKIEILYKYLNFDELKEIKDYYLEQIINKDKDEFNILKYKLTFYKNIYNIFKIIKIYSNDIKDINDRIKLIFDLKEEELKIILYTYKDLNNLLDIDDLKITLYIFNILKKSFSILYLEYDYEDKNIKLFLYFTCLYSYIIDDLEIYNYIINDIFKNNDYNIFKSYWINKNNSIMKIIKDCNKKNNRNKILDLTNLKKYKKDFSKEENKKIYIKLLLQYFNNLTDINNINLKILEKRKIISCDYCNGFCYKDNNFLICNICNKKYCLYCYKEISNNHICKNEDLETIKLLFQKSKRCPNCYNLIEKNEGCKDMWCRFCDTLFNWDTLEIMNKSTNEIYNKFKQTLYDDIIEYNNLNINEKDLFNYFNNIIDLKQIYKFNKINYDNNINISYFNKMKIKILFYISNNNDKNLELNYYNYKFKNFIQNQFYINYYNFLIDKYNRIMNKNLFDIKNNSNSTLNNNSFDAYYILLNINKLNKSNNDLLKNINNVKTFLNI